MLPKKKYAIQDMPPEEVARFRRKARITARARGFYDLVEDFENEVFLGLADRPSATIDQLFVDYVRKIYGDQRRHVGRQKGATFDTDGDVSLIQDLAKSAESRVLWKQIKNAVQDKRARAVLVLRYEYSLQCYEIGDCMGMTEGNVCLILTHIQGEIKRFLEGKIKTIQKKMDKRATCPECWKR